MKTASVYDKKTGLFVGRTFSCADQHFEAYATSNCPRGMGYKVGSFDRLSQRVDTASGEVVAYQPPQPSAEHEWNGTRWVLSEAAVQALRERAAAQARVLDEETRQARVVREWILSQPNPPARLVEIESAIVAVRSALK